MESILYNAVDVKSTVCAKGTDFEHQVYWLDNGQPEGTSGYRFRYLTKDEEAQYAIDKLALDAAAADRELKKLAASVAQPLTLEDM